MNVTLCVCVCKAWANVLGVESRAVTCGEPMGN